MSSLDQPPLTCSRRTFLGIGGAALTATLAGCDTEEREDPPKSGWIDAHTHLWTPDTTKFPLGAWAKVTDMKPASFTAEEWMNVARPEGVEKAVLVTHSPLYGFDSSYLIDCMQRYPGVFSLIGRVDERKPDREDQLKQQKKLGLRGVRVGTDLHADRTPVQDPPNWHKTEGMQKLWKLAADHHVAICPLLAPKYLPTLDVMCEQFPKTRCVVDHMAQVELKNESQIENLLRLSRHPNVYVKVSAFYKFGKPPYTELSPLIEKLVRTFGASRLMWGSDCPYQLAGENSMAASVKLMTSGLEFLKKSERRDLLQDVAHKIFFD